MTSLEPSIQSFLAALAVTPHLWRSVDLRLVAVRLLDDWYCIGALGRLDARSPQDVEPLAHLPRTETLRAVQMALPIAQLPELLRQIATGRARLMEGPDIRFAQSPPKAPSDASDSVAEHADSPCLVDGMVRLAAEVRESAALPYRHAHTLSIYADPADDFIRRMPLSVDDIDRSLLSLPEPWESVHRMLQVVLRRLTRTDNRIQLLFEAPLGTALDLSRCSLSRGTLHYGVLCATREACACASLGYFGTTANGLPVSGTVAVHERRWFRDAAGFRTEGRVAVHGARELALILRLNSEAVLQHSVRDAGAAPSPFTTAYRVVDPDLKRLRELLLSPKDSEARSFEYAVARLLALLGLSAISLSDEKDSDNLDAIASAPSVPWLPLLAIECTVRPLKGDGKLAKLVRRTQGIRSALEAAGIATRQRRASPIDWDVPPLQPARVLPVMVVAWTRAEIARGEIEAAGLDGVAVLGKEDLADLLAMAERAAPLHEVAGLFESRVVRRSASPRLIL